MAKLSRIKIRVQPFFSPFAFELCNMNLHRHGDTRKADTVVVFVHGLNGDGYKTWGEFPERIFNNDNGPATDVAIYDYFSGSQRFLHGWLRVRPEAPEIALTLAQCIVDLERHYEQVFLVGHSMGGLICKDAIRSYLDSYERSPSVIKSIAGAILFASPLAGSNLALAFLSPAIVEIKYLRRGAKYQKEIRKFFDMHVDSTDIPSPGNRNYMIPIYAGYGGIDWIVKSNSATSGVFHKQICSFPRAGHRKVVKPTEEAHEQVSWLQEAIVSVTINRAKIRQQIYHAERNKTSLRTDREGIFVIEMLSEPDGHQWRYIYQQVISEASTDTVSVVDNSEIQLASDMLVSVHTAENITAGLPTSSENLAEARQRYQLDNIEVRIVSVGPEIEEVTAILRQYASAGDATGRPPWLYFNTVLNAQQLRERLHEYISYMTSAIERRAKWARYRGGDRKAAGTDDTSIMSSGDFI